MIHGHLSGQQKYNAYLTTNIFILFNYYLYLIKSYASSMFIVQLFSRNDSRLKQFFLRLLNCI